ncbi:hypothetical protein, conserved [Eimeria maxima]|uniref:Uncharacterized protein n=1 Tax=Eimeria maxima TaxID=5804 RepID=U6MBU6_EIMMA|nr:hypothetical protein, conserved [Eimeria maxima]CDJ61687.1 hypothetical protein, conserved [Eimeria maxima]
MRLQQIALDLYLDPKAQPMRELLQRKGLGEFAAFPAAAVGEAAETQQDEKQALLEQEIEDFLAQESIRERLLLTVDARLQQQQQQQQQQQHQQQQQQDEEEQQQDEDEQQQQQQQELEQLADKESLKRVGVSVHFKDFPCLRTYRVASLFVWPTAAAAAAATAAGGAAGATVTAEEVLQGEQQAYINSSSSSSSSRYSLAVLGDVSTLDDYVLPSEVYVHLKYKHLNLAGHALIAVREQQWREAEDDEDRLLLLVNSLQLPTTHSAV